MANVNYSEKSICAHLKDGTAEITGSEGSYKLYINGVETQDLSDGERDDVFNILTASKGAADSNLTVAGLAAMEAAQQSISDESAAALLLIA